MLDFLLCQDFDAVDTKLLLVFHELQKEFGDVKQLDVAKAMGVSTATIERRLSRLKDLGAIDVEKTGTRRRRYDVPLLILSEAKNLTSRMDEKYSLAGEGSSSPSSQVFLGSIINNFQSTNTKTSDSSSSSDVHNMMLAMMENFAEEEAMKFSGPTTGKIADAIASASERTKRVHKEVRQKRIERQKMNADLSPESISTDRESRYQEYLAKHPSEYNQTDFRFLFEDKWKESGWKSKPVRWTGKNAGQLKDMVKDQGEEIVAEYITHVFDHWTELKRRFTLTSSYPVLEVIYAFRKQWIPEMIDGEIKGKKSQIQLLDEVNYYSEEDMEKQSKFTFDSEEDVEDLPADEEKTPAPCDTDAEAETEDATPGCVQETVREKLSFGLPTGDDGRGAVPGVSSSDGGNDGGMMTLFEKNKEARLKRLSKKKTKILSVEEYYRLEKEYAEKNAGDGEDSESDSKAHTG